MPYTIKKVGRKHQVINTETGDIKAESTSRAKAERQLKLLNSLECDWTKTGEDTYTRKVNGKKATVRVTGGKGRGSKRRAEEAAS